MKVKIKKLHPDARIPQSNKIRPNLYVRGNLTVNGDMAVNAAGGANVIACLPESDVDLTNAIVVDGDITADTLIVNSRVIIAVGGDVSFNGTEFLRTD